MAVAKHIQIAREDGPEAGLEAYLDAPSSKRHPAYGKITRKRTKETQLAAYCEQFKAQLGDVARPRVTGASENVADVRQQLIERLAAALTGGTQEVEPEVVEEEPEPVVEENPILGMLAQALGVDVEKIASVMGGQSNDGKTTADTDVDFITSGEAWQTLIDLGDDPNFPAPQNPDRPATNGQLFRLNATHGVLSLNV